MRVELEPSEPNAEPPICVVVVPLELKSVLPILVEELPLE